MANIVPANLNVILDVETRWNATHNMLTRFKTLIGFRLKCFQPKINNTWMNIGQNLKGWEQLDKLKPLKEIRKFMSKSKLSSLLFRFTSVVWKKSIFYLHRTLLQIQQKRQFFQICSVILKKMLFMLMHDLGSKIQVCLIKKKENILL